MREIGREENEWEGSQTLLGYLLCLLGENVKRPELEIYNV